MKYFKLSILLAFVISIFSNCDKNNIISEGNDPNFKIVVNDDDILKNYNRKVEIFGINIYAVPKVDDIKLLHAANLMAQYLDNDEDGFPDNQALVDKMIEEKAFMIMWNKQRNLLFANMPDGWTGQDLGNDETNPGFVTNNKSGQFDAALEEVLHIITHAGYAKLYPNIFGETIGSSISMAMDTARGGQFTEIPSTYPANAWYFYDDKTCDYSCMVTEYHYWALTSILGAQENRLGEIDKEWKLNTKEKVEQQDVAVYQLLTDPQYKFPIILPDGTYKR